MNNIIHRADTRGQADHGWLKTNHTFSFANYYDPERIRFGALRVLNDDFIEGGGGFGMHPHDNMEIITIPLSGTLEHRDSMGNAGTIEKNEVQVMSAGTGIMHSEFNASEDEGLSLLQIWVLPNKHKVEPRYGQLKFNPEDRKNKFQQIVSPDKDDAGLRIHQDSWFNLINLDSGNNIDYKLHKENNGLYVFIIDGEADIEGERLNKRDAIGISEKGEIKISAIKGSEILIMEVPMV